jgi:cytochrome d ubiquinol oxidase subunit II
MTVDIVVVWTLVISFGLMMYVLLEGLSLSTGLLFLSVKKREDRDTLVRSRVSLWDGHELWLLISALALMAVFPKAYAIIWDALYIPLCLMLLGLLGKNLALVLRSQSSNTTSLRYDTLISVSSIIAAFFQGVSMGALVKGVGVEDQLFLGGAFDWLSWFSVLSGVSLLVAYALLGATWMINKTDGPFQNRMREVSKSILKYFGYALCLILFCTPFLNDDLKSQLLSLSNLFFIGFFVSLLSVVYIWLFYLLALTKTTLLPFGVSLGLLGSSYLILILCLWPNIIPPTLSIYETQTPESNLNLGLAVIAVVIPMLLAYVYWLYFGIKKGAR